MERHPATAFALNQFHSEADMSVSEIIDETGLTARKFIDLFRNEVGMTPKLYRRIHRFQQLLKRVHGSQRVDWSHVALDCGYYDQAHCIHDFGEFAGLNPTAYLRLVPLRD